MSSAKFNYRNSRAQGRGGSSGGSGGGRGGGGGHPPWLKGKEIGLYYRDKAKRNNSKNEVTTNTIKLNIDIERRIRSLIDYQTSSSSSFFVRQTIGVKCSLLQGVANERFENMYMHINDSQFKQEFLRIVSGNIQENLIKSILTKSKLERNELLDEEFLQEHSKMVTSKQYTDMLKFRAKLPAYNRRQEILNLLKEHQVILISGETGCGKTTQVAQFILDNQIEERNGSITKVVCTQPRRISAISVAERVAAERAEILGNSVGYQIRLERVQSRQQGCILFCTTGMLLQFMQNDPALTEISHIILDEIHERNTESDFIMALLKQVIPKRPDLKIILMSATLNCEQFSKYYGNCPRIHIPGFTFPVEEFYLEDVILFTRFHFPEDTKNNDQRNHYYKKYSKKHKHQAEEAHDNHLVFIQSYLRHLESQNKYPQFVLNELRNPKSEELSLELVEQLVTYICVAKDPGAILIFLPGLMDIKKLNNIMVESGRYPRDRYIIYPLHSRMPTADQKLIFDVPEHGIRKIIISTSIAETSITIEDVVYVIDCGKTKLSRFDIENNVQTLLPEWITIANSQQRRGRAGRVKPGICYHLYSKARENAFDRYPLPEMLRSRLEEVILQIKILQLGKANTFLVSVMDPPDPKAIDLSLDLLRKLNALDMNEHLTPLGYHLAQLPLDPRTGKMIIWAALFSCIEPVFAIAASLSFKDAFYCPLQKEDEARRKKIELGMGQFSDHIALAEALSRFEQNFHNKQQTASFCREYFLSWNTLRLLSDMKSQFARHLCEMKFLQNDNPSDMNANRHSNNLSLIKAIVCAGLYPNIALVRGITKYNVKTYTPEDGRVKIHPSSINEKIRSLPSTYLIYFLKKRSSAIYLHDTTFVSPWALLFANPNRFTGEREGKSIITLSNSLTFYCEPTTAQIIQRLREKLDALLEYKITHPGSVDWDSQEGRIIKAIVELLSQGEEEMGLESGTYHHHRQHHHVDEERDLEISDDD